MKFEVTYGGITRFYSEAGNIYQACMDALREHVNELDATPIENFRVINLETNEEEEVDFQIVFYFTNHANEPLALPVPSEQAELDMENQWMEEETCSLKSS